MTNPDVGTQSTQEQAVIGVQERIQSFWTDLAVEASKPAEVRSAVALEQHFSRAARGRAAAALSVFDGSRMVSYFDDVVSSRLVAESPTRIEWNECRMRRLTTYEEASDDESTFSLRVAYEYTLILEDGDWRIDEHSSAGSC